MQTDTLYLAVLACPRRKLTRDLDPVFIATYTFFPPWAAQRYHLSRISRTEYTKPTDACGRWVA